MRTHDRECALRTVELSRPKRVIQESGTCMTVATVGQPGQKRIVSVRQSLTRTSMFWPSWRPG